MIVDTNAVPGLEEIKQGILSRMAESERAMIAAAAEARTAQQAIARSAHQAQIEAQAVNGLRELRARYIRRAQIVRDLAPLLGELAQLDAQIKRVLETALAPALATCGHDTWRAEAMADDLRARAGIAGHSVIGVEVGTDEALALAATVATGIAGDQIGPRWLRVSTKTTKFDF